MSRLGIVFVALILSCTGASRAAVLMYFEENGDGGANPRGLYNFDTTTGTSTLRTTVGGSERFFGIDMRPSDETLFAVSYEPTPAIFTINPNNGAFALVGLTGLGSNMVGLAVQPGTNKLFGLTNSSGLYSVDQSTGAATFIGPTLANRGLVFSPSGQLFGFAQNGALYTIDPTNGNATAVGGSGNPVTNIAEDAAFTPTGELYATDFNGKIFKTDPLTGNGTLIGNTNMGFGLLGLAVVPEPAGITLLALAAGTFATCRIRRRAVS